MKSEIFFDEDDEFDSAKLDIIFDMTIIGSRFEKMVVFTVLELLWTG